MRVLLFGATGFAGSHFRRATEEAGFEVVGASRRTGSAEVTCDLLDAASVDAAVRDVGPERIVNLAGAASVAASFRQPARTFQVNATGVLNLLEATAKHASHVHLLCVSSGDVYGAVDEERLPITESEPLAPVSPYGSSKSAMELLCGQYERSAGLAIGILRAFNHTGPGQSDDFAASSFARQVAEAERDGADEVVLRTGDLSVARDFSDVRDVAVAYRGVVEQELTGTFNACSGRPTRVGELVDHLRAATSIPVSAVTDPERLRAAEVPVLYGSPAHLRDATGWQARTQLAQTMGDLLEWWRRKVRE
jgi:GDP-4-dehydro-6-deoxy-D-mannose reductase